VLFRSKDLTAASEDLRQARNQLAATQIQAGNLEREISRLDRQVEELSAEKSQVEKAVATLRSETESLKKGLAEMKEGSVIAFQGELLAQAAVEGGASASVINEALEGLIRTAEETLTVKNRESGILKVAGALPKVAITEAERRKIHAAIGASKERKLLRFTAPSNVVQGQVVNGVVAIFDSRLVFRKDDVLMTETIRSGLEQSDAADVLYTMLKQINRIAVSRGVLPDPISGAVGNLDSLDFYEAVDKISESKETLSVEFVAAEDIYTEGPVNLKIILGEG
jgi:uncharacterized protein (DUF3084 family)